MVVSGRQTFAAWWALFSHQPELHVHAQQTLRLWLEDGLSVLTTLADLILLPRRTDRLQFAIFRQVLHFIWPNCGSRRYIYRQWGRRKYQGFELDTRQRNRPVCECESGPPSVSQSSGSIPAGMRLITFQQRGVGTSMACPTADSAGHCVRSEGDAGGWFSLSMQTLNNVRLGTELCSLCRGQVIISPRLRLGRSSEVSCPKFRWVVVIPLQNWIIWDSATESVLSD